jgi:hypothetical protein
MYVFLRESRQEINLRKEVKKFPRSGMEGGGHRKGKPGLSQASMGSQFDTFTKEHKEEVFAMRTSKTMMWIVTALASLALAAIAGAGAMTYPPEAQSAHDMKLVGWHPDDGRPIYHPHIQKQGNRWILYLAEHVTINKGTSSSPEYVGPRGNGTTILDVTDPTKPVFLWHKAGNPGVGGAILSDADAAKSPLSESRSVRVCERNGKFYMLRQMPQAGYEIYDVTVPENPVKRAHIFENGQTNTHKINWECDSGVAYLPWRTKGDGWGGVYLKIWNLANPENPQPIRNYGRPGLEPGSTLPIPSGVHHTGLDPDRKRVYVNYSCCGTGAWQITDRTELLTGNPTDMVAPSRGIWDAPTYLGVHSTYAMPGLVNPELEVDKLTDADKYRIYALVIGEAGGNGCNRQRQFTQVWDATQNYKGWVVAGYQVPEDSGDFCSKGGRFGPHGSNEQVTEKFHKKLVGISYFNAGLRVLDIRQPFWPVEVAYYIPRPNQNTFYCDEGCASVIQTNNVEMDERGYFYIVDRAGTGMHILELTGEAKKIIE